MASGREGSWLSRDGASLNAGALSNISKYFTPRMWKMLITAAVVLILLFGYIIGWPIFKFMVLMPKGAFGPQPQTVSTVHAKPSLWQTQVKAVATLHAVQGANLASELAGIVTRIGFKAGDDVQKGQVLIQLRDDSDRAQLAALRADAEVAAQTYARNAALMRSNAISKQQYDTALANMKATRAQADAQAALVDKKAIRAPYDGRVGIRQVDVGQYVNAGQTVVTLEQLDPIYADFYVPQQQLLMLKPGSNVTLTTDAAPGKTYTGEIMATDPAVDPTTRNVHVRALIHDPDKLLYPGMFARVVTAVGKPQSFITLPQTAITFNPYGNTVFVVTKSLQSDGTEKLVVEQHFVTTGETRGDQIAITSGLTTRDVVVSAGGLKLKNGTEVRVNNSIRLPDNPEPHPVQQ
jgi:membrane fusion protein, multidrug efflux system